MTKRKKKLLVSGEDIFIDNGDEEWTSCIE